VGVGETVGVKVIVGLGVVVGVLVSVGVGVTVGDAVGVKEDVADGEGELVGFNGTGERVIELERAGWGLELWQAATTKLNPTRSEASHLYDIVRVTRYWAFMPTL
jgi:hypothetical protein